MFDPEPLTEVLLYLTMMHLELCVLTGCDEASRPTAAATRSQVPQVDEGLGGLLSVVRCRLNRSTQNRR
jgi:hypothetical protein